MDELETLLNALEEAYDDYTSAISAEYATEWPPAIKRVEAAKLKYEAARQAILDYVERLIDDSVYEGSRQDKN